MKMLLSHFFIIIFVVVLILSHAGISLADDGPVMADVLRGFTKPPSGWDSKKPYCNWDGVSCDPSGNVVKIDLNTKSIAGNIASNINQLPSLEVFIVLRNTLSGMIPSFANMKNLKELDLGNNNFESMDKDFLVGLTSLEALNLGNNLKLAPWGIPNSISDSTTLRTFSCPYSNAVGSLPDVFDKLPNLQSLRLSNNNGITGTLPPSLASSGLQNLWLNNNALNGTIDVLSSMTQLTQVWLHANMFTGPIPDLSKNTNLFDLQLRDNQFTGPFPQSLLSMPNLVNVTLTSNRLQGQMPQARNGMQLTLGDENKFCNPTPDPCDPQVDILIEIAGGFGYPMALAEAWVGNDACKGWKSIRCDAQMKSVTVVNFAKQGMVGTISPAFSKLTSVESILLNDNLLTDEIPQSLTSLPKLQVIDVSNNNLSGPIPAFSSGVKFSYTGNPWIGKKLNGSGAGGTGWSGVSGWAIAGIVISAMVFICVVSFVAYRLVMNGRHTRFVKLGGSGRTGASSASRAQSMESGYPVSPTGQSLDGGNIFIEYKILQQATNNFSDKKELGRGGFGIVYKGKLPDKTEIAVKRMESGSMGQKGMQEFKAEISVLTKVRHRHLVTLLGYCVNGHEKLLVYEFMPQGTLSEHLFDPKANRCQPLSWKQRVAIALDVARGVEYLHTLAQQSFIHRDLKPTNVLLDNDMRAKVADFGLVKMTDSNCSIETKLAGTFGYLAPEYAATGRVTTKVDVYAFGVILMEIISGRKALDDNFSEDRSHLVAFFRKVVGNEVKLRKEIDPNLHVDDETYASISKVAQLAGHCTVRESTQRPDMGHVVGILSPLVQEWKPSRNNSRNDDGDYDDHSSDDDY